MKRIIAKNQHKFMGELDDDILVDLFTGEVMDAGAYKEVGFIDTPERLTRIYGNLYLHRMMGTPTLEFYMLGNVSARKKLRYVQMNHTVLMGFSDHYATPNGNVYFFKKCGEVEGVPVFTYLNDMVIKEDEIMWVHAGENSPTKVPNNVN